MMKKRAKTLLTMNKLNLYFLLFYSIFFDRIQDTLTVIDFTQSLSQIPKKSNLGFSPHPFVVTLMQFQQPGTIIFHLECNGHSGTNTVPVHHIRIIQLTCSLNLYNRFIRGKGIPKQCSNSRAYFQLIFLGK